MEQSSPLQSDPAGPRPKTPLLKPHGHRAASIAAAMLALSQSAAAVTVGTYSAAKSVFNLGMPSGGGVVPQPVKIQGARKSWLPVLGSGTFKYGLYDRKSGTFHLRLEEGSGPLSKRVQFDGTRENWLPIAGDWDGDGAFGIGLYDPASGTFYLKNQLTDGPAEATARLEGAKKHWKPLAGDWDGDGVATIGAYDPRSGQFRLRNSNTGGPADVSLQIQGLKKALLPLAADWNGDGIWSPGLYSSASRSFYWRNALSTGPQEGIARLAGAKANALPVAGSIAKGVAKPDATDIGTPTGAAASVTIGAAGGTLQSTDNHLLLTVPPGALAADTVISIQPISNHAHGGKGAAYRLTPDGQTFDQPVTLTFSYTDQDLLGTAAEALGAAYQSAEGYWRWIENSVLDAGARTVSVATTHFTDFSLVEGLNLRPGEAKVMVNGTVNLQVRFCYQKTVDTDGLLAELGMDCEGAFSDVTTLVPVSEWAVNGVPGGDGSHGTISDTGAQAAVFTAPARKPSPATVAVSARLPIDGATVLVSRITIQDDAKAYKGKLEFSQLGVSGTADITWTQFEDLGDVRRFRPSGNIVATIESPSCDPLTATIPIDSGTDDKPTSTLVVYTETSPFAKQYHFGLQGDPGTELHLTCYRDAAHKVAYDKPYMGSWVGIPVITCPSSGADPLSFLHYDDEAKLSGTLACADPQLNAGWTFDAIVAE